MRRGPVADAVHRGHTQSSACARAPPVCMRQLRELCARDTERQTRVDRRDINNAYPRRKTTLTHIYTNTDYVRITATDVFLRS